MAARRGKIKSAVGKRQAATVMKTFAKGKLRRPGGAKITAPRVAKAVAMSEARAAESRGVSRRTYMGRTRMRPKLKGRRARSR